MNSIWVTALLEVHFNFARLLSTFSEERQCLTYQRVCHPKQTTHLAGFLTVQ